MYRMGRRVCTGWGGGVHTRVGEEGYVQGWGGGVCTGVWGGGYVQGWGRRDIYRVGEGRDMYRDGRGESWEEEVCTEKSGYVGALYIFVSPVWNF